MRRTKILGFGLIASVIAAIGLASVASAVWSPHLQSSDDTVTVSTGKTHTGSLYAAGKDVTIDGIVTGSLYCAGTNVTVNGTVEGDVLCAGQDLTINGTVGGDVRVAGQSLRIDGAIAGSLTAFGEDVRVDEDARIGGDVNGAAQKLILDGTVGRDVTIGVQNFTLNGAVKGTVDVATGQLRVGSKASVLGNLNYSSDKEASFDTALVKGDVSFNPSDSANPQGLEQFLGAVKMIFIVMSALSALVIMLIMPQFVDRSSKLFRDRLLMTILIGFAFVMGAPILAALLIFSVVFLPLGLALLFGWLTVLVLSGVFFAYWVGSELLRTQSNIAIRMLGGVVIVAIGYMIPFLSPLVLFTAVIVGSGMIIVTLTNGYRRPSYDLATPTKKITKTTKKTAA